MSVEELVRDLKSPDCQVAIRAAEQLANATGAEVTAALIESLDADDTAVGAAAMRALIVRNEPGTIERLWPALAVLDEDALGHVWDEVWDLASRDLSKELERRSHDAGWTTNQLATPPPDAELSPLGKDGRGSSSSNA